MFKGFAQGAVATLLAGGFAYCIAVLFSPSPVCLAAVVLLVLVGLAYTAKKWN